jgi:hypothetical protein
VSNWKTRVPRKLSATFSISTIIESSLIMECALAICSKKGEISVSSAIAFEVCDPPCLDKLNKSSFFLGGYCTTEIPFLSGSYQPNVVLLLYKISLTQCESYHTRWGLGKGISR